MKSRKIITFLIIALMMAYVLEVERRVIQKYPQVVEVVKAKMDVHLVSIR